MKYKYDMYSNVSVEPMLGDKWRLKEYDTRLTVIFMAPDVVWPQMRSVHV